MPTASIITLISDVDLDARALDKIRLDAQAPTVLCFEDRRYQASYHRDHIRITLGNLNHTRISLKSQHVAYKSTIMGGFALAEEHEGQTDYGRDFMVAWEHDRVVPELVLHQPPKQVYRQYQKGSHVELGLEEVHCYLIRYADGVEARFERHNAHKFRFCFSTGFYGAFRQRRDGAYTLTFKGDRLLPDEDDYHSQSKFVITRSRYTGNPLLILQDEATVWLA